MSESSPIVNAGAAIVGTSNTETSSQQEEVTHVPRKPTEEDIINNLLEEENEPKAGHRKNSSSVVDPDFINAPPRRNSLGKVNDIDALVRRASIEDVLKAARDERNTEDEKKKARRAENAAKMAGMTLRPTLRKNLGGALNELTKGISRDAPAEEKLEKILTAAKQSGMSLEQIFSHFNPNNDTTDISEEVFAKGLEELNSDDFFLSKEDCHMLVQKFDLDGDHNISLEEFLQYVLSLTSVTWKAERNRRTTTASMAMGSMVGSLALNSGSPGGGNKSRRGSVLVDKDGRRLSIVDSLKQNIATGAGGEPQREMVPYKESSVFLWRERQNAFIHYWIYDAIPYIISIVIRLDNPKKYFNGFDPIYINKNDIPIQDENLEKLLEEKLAIEKPGVSKTAISADELKTLKDAVLKEYIVFFLEQRLVINEEAEVPVSFKKLMDDTWENLVSEKPEFLAPPRPIESRKKSTYADFERLSMDMSKENKKLEGEVQTARRASKELDSARLSAVLQTQKEA